MMLSCLNCLFLTPSTRSMIIILRVTTQILRKKERSLKKALPSTQNDCRIGPSDNHAPINPVAFLVIFVPEITHMKILIVVPPQARKPLISRKKQTSVVTLLNSGREKFHRYQGHRSYRPRFHWEYLEISTDHSVTIVVARVVGSRAARNCGEEERKSLITQGSRFSRLLRSESARRIRRSAKDRNLDARSIDCPEKGCAFICQVIIETDKKIYRPFKHLTWPKCLLLLKSNNSFSFKL